MYTSHTWGSFPHFYWKQFLISYQHERRNPSHLIEYTWLNTMTQLHTHWIKLLLSQWQQANPSEQLKNPWKVTQSGSEQYLKYITFLTTVRNIKKTEEENCFTMKFTHHTNLLNRCDIPSFLRDICSANHTQFQLSVSLKNCLLISKPLWYFLRLGW